ncbi:PepSY domain-containing protein [Nioella sp. MMSF_3534]|uniref:PepSY domain-containing protein n=1 Tax=Nioella sp. MMSF_3534 TaxID=3046720 RepID=UPI00273DDD8A|nr:PepSY domain-containing protein [Nioella sp. MMSF_3534]
MKTTLTALALISVLPAGAALADDDDCRAPRDRWQPREAAMQLAEQNGWSVREFEIDDGCYEIEGRDAEGRAIEVSLDPESLEIVELEYEDDEDDGGYANSRNPAPAGSAAPPQNGLFGSGAAPQVQVN